MQDFAKIVTRELRARRWTGYRLAKECAGRVTQPTVYSFLAGKPVKSDTLAVIFDVLDITVVVVKPAKEPKQ